MIKKRSEKKAAVTKLPETKNTTKKGRPSAYKPEFCEIAYKLCLLGMTNDELAQYFHVATSTIDKWIAEIQEFSGSLKKGREIADSNVTDRLYQRAMGYSHPEDKVFLHEGQPVVVPTVKHYPPDPVSAIFWLKNRQRKRWRDKPLDTDADEKLKFRVGYGGEYD